MASFFAGLLAARAQSGFPESWVGIWKGTLAWYPGGGAAARTVNMELHIAPADTVGQYQWRIVYGQPGEDNRPYLLKAVDTAKGHWVVDERNGIVLDQYWMGGKLSGSFSLGKTQLVNTYWIENGELQVEFFSLNTVPVRTSGEGTEESPKVDSYRLSSYQRARLRRD